MTLKLQGSLYLALIAGMLTLLVGVISSLTPTVILYRALVSVVLFAILGYTFGQFYERYLLKKASETLPQDEKMDVLSFCEHIDESPASEFKPLNPDSFENITLTQK